MARYGTYTLLSAHFECNKDCLLYAIQQLGIGTRVELYSTKKIYLVGVLRNTSYLIRAVQLPYVCSHSEKWPITRTS